MVPYRREWVLFVSVVIANLPDVDFLPGYLLGDLTTFHHQATHSITAAVIVGLLIAALASRWKFNGIGWGVWGGSVYLSHVVFDLLVNDPSPPFGVQLLWPFSDSYFISPFTPFARFDYFDPTAGMVSTMLSVHNLITMLREFVLVAPIVALAWFVGKFCNRRHVES